MGASLLAAAIIAAALVVPAQYDVLAQLLSTAIYGALAYGVLRGFSAYAGKGWALAVLLMAVSLAVSYAAESIRWFITIRGKHAVLHHS
jgi:hypothetical protein